MRPDRFYVEAIAIAAAASAAMLATLRVDPELVVARVRDVGALHVACTVSRRAEPLPSP